jgi:hypothetical protein
MREQGMMMVAHSTPHPQPASSPPIDLFLLISQHAKMKNIVSLDYPLLMIPTHRELLAYPYYY